MDKTQKTEKLKIQYSLIQVCVCVLLLLQSRQVLCQWWGSQMLWQAPSYFGPSTNQALNMVTPCIAKAWRVSIGPPAAPGVLPLLHWVICAQACGKRNEPFEDKWKLPSTFSGCRWPSSCCGFLNFLSCCSSVCLLDVLLRTQSVCLPLLFISIVSSSNPTTVTSLFLNEINVTTSPLSEECFSNFGCIYYA